MGQATVILMIDSCVALLYIFIAIRQLISHNDAKEQSRSAVRSLRTLREIKFNIVLDVQECDARKAS